MTMKEALLMIDTVTASGEYDPDRNWQYSRTANSGLYFIGNIEYNPTLQKPIYWVKIGSAENIQKRMAAYRSHNPSYWHNNCVFTVASDALRRPYEKMAHRQLKACSIGNHPNATEWFEVTEESYFKLCYILQTEEGFKNFLRYGIGVKEDD